MSQEKLCQVCGQAPAVAECSVCQMPLCDGCSREVVIQEGGPGYLLKGTVVSSLRPAEQRRKMCPQCFKEVELL